MSQPSPINITFLQTFILQESENEAIQKLSPNFYESLSKYIGDLKNEEYDGVEGKIKNSLLSMVTDIVSLLLKLRLEKAISTSSSQSTLLVFSVMFFGVEEGEDLNLILEEFPKKRKSILSKKDLIIVSGDLK